MRQKPGPKPRHPRPVQLELLELVVPAKGFFGAVDRLAQKGELEMARTAAALLELGWTLVTTRDGTWRAHHRGRHHTLTNYTAQGLVRSVRALEEGDASGQLELLPVPAPERVREKPVHNPSAPVSGHIQRLRVVGERDESQLLELVS